MKNIKNKSFYVYSCLIYMFLAITAFMLSFVYLEPSVKSFFISTFSANKVGSESIVEIVIDDASISKYAWPWANNMYTEILDYFSTYSKPKTIGLDIFLPSLNPMSKADVDFLNKISKMDNLVTSFTPELGLPDKDDIKYLNDFKNKFSLNINQEALSLPTKYYKISKLQNLYDNKIKNSASVRIERDRVAGNVFAATNLYNQTLNIMQTE